MVVGAGGLHPFSDGYPGFVRADFGDAEIAHSGAFLRDEDLLRAADDLELVRIDAGDEERGAMPEDVIIVGPHPRVDEKEAFPNRDPVLLSVVVAEWRSIVELPLLNRIEMNAVRSRSHLSRVISPQGEIEPVAKSGE